MIAIIKSCGSNFASIQYALDRRGVASLVTDDPEVILKADKVILAGVGHAERAMENLLEADLIKIINNITQPILGICLGMQLLYESSEEGEVDCLGIIPGRIKRFPKKSNYPIPHMGWNDNKYFVHSYYAPVNQYTIETCSYINDFTCVVRKNNFVGMQFHPERSGKVGEDYLKKFLEGELE